MSSHSVKNDNLIDSEYDSKYRVLYKEGAKEYDKRRFSSLSGSFAKRYKNELIIELLNKRNLLGYDMKILDLASGTGRIAYEIIHKHHAKVICADITLEMLQVSKEKSDKPSSGTLSWMQANMKELPFRANVFDVVTIGSFFYLIPPWCYRNYLKDVFRIIKPEGILVCEISNVLTLFNLGSFVSILLHKHLLSKSVKSYIYPWQLSHILPLFKLVELRGLEYPLLSRKYEHYRRYSQIMGKSRATKYFGGKFLLVLNKRYNHANP